jgi:hypothetical protein
MGKADKNWAKTYKDEIFTHENKKFQSKFDSHPKLFCLKKPWNLRVP